MIKTQPNENRCGRMEEVHELDLPECCPVSRNPRQGSTLRIEYTPGDRFIEVFSLHKYINEYIGGRNEVRSMEGMVQQIATDCAKALGVDVLVTARLNIHPSQKMILRCTGTP